MARMSVLLVGSLFGLARNRFAAAGAVAIWPSNKSGAIATKPSLASRSQTLLKKGFNPHQAWISTTPAPFPEGGRARYTFGDWAGFLGTDVSLSDGDDLNNQRSVQRIRRIGFSTQQFVIIRVAPNPEPNKSISGFDRERTKVKADSNRMIFSNAFEVEGRMARVCF